MTGISPESSAHSAPMHWFRIRTQHEKPVHDKATNPIRLNSPSWFPGNSLTEQILRQLKRLDHDVYLVHRVIQAK